MSSLLFHCFFFFFFFRCVIFLSLSLFLFEFLLLERKPWLIFMKSFEIFHYFFSKKICSWRFIQGIYPLNICSWRFVHWRFVQGIYPLNICLWRFFHWKFVQEIYPFEVTFFFFFFEIDVTCLLKFWFFFWELTKSTQSNLSWLSNSGGKKGGVGEFYGPHLFCFFFPFLLFPLLSSFFLHCYYLHTSPTCIFSLITQFLLQKITFLSFSTFFHSSPSISF